MISVVSGMAGARCNGRAILGLNFGNAAVWSAVINWEDSLKPETLTEMLNPSETLEAATAMSELLGSVQIGLMGSGAYWLWKRLPRDPK